MLAGRRRHPASARRSTAWSSTVEIVDEDGNAIDRADLEIEPTTTTPTTTTPQATSADDSDRRGREPTRTPTEHEERQRVTEIRNYSRPDGRRADQPR